MNVLFVCRYNVGRSQMAAIFFNKYSRNGHADSAGTMVGDDDGQTLQERAKIVEAAQQVIDSMRDDGFDISQNTRTQLSEDMLEGYDKIVVMAEPEVVPEYLSQNPKAEYWQVEDPRGKGRPAVDVTKNDIKDKVVQLVKKPEDNLTEESA